MIRRAAVIAGMTLLLVSSLIPAGAADEDCTPGHRFRYEPTEAAADFWIFPHACDDTGALGDIEVVGTMTRTDQTGTTATTVQRVALCRSSLQPCWLTVSLFHPNLEITGYQVTFEYRSTGQHLIAGTIEVRAGCVAAVVVADCPLPT